MTWDAVSEWEGKRNWRQHSALLGDLVAENGHPDLEGQKVGNTQGLLCWIWNGFVLSSISETLAQMIEENLNCLGHLSTIIREANEDQSSSMMSLDWSWLAEWHIIRALFSSLWSCSSTYCGHLSCGSHSSLTSPWRRQLWSETTNDFTHTRAWCFVFK